MKFMRWSFGALLLLAAVPSYAGTAYSLGAASGYNVFVFSNYSTLGWTDIQGSTAVGGNFTSLGSLGFDQTPGNAAPAAEGLVVGGNLSLGGGQLNGDAWVKGTTYSNNYFGSFTITGDLHSSSAQTGAVNVYGSSTRLGTNPLPIDFASAVTSLTQLSNALTNMTANGTVSGSASSYMLTATNCTLCVFNVNGGSINSVTINAPTGATVVVNVSGTSNSFSNGSINYTGGATAANTIFNFGAATTLTTSSISFEGSILAPLATFTGSNGQINGELIAKAVSNQTAEFESGNIFRGNLNGVNSSPVSATPEPSTWLSIATGLFALLCVRRRNRLRHQKHFVWQMCYTKEVLK